jgi:hypothetical protein
MGSMARTRRRCAANGGWPVGQNDRFAQLLARRFQPIKAAFGHRPTLVTTTFVSGYPFCSRSIRKSLCKKYLQKSRVPCNYRLLPFGLG